MYVQLCNARREARDLMCLLRNCNLDVTICSVERVDRRRAKMTSVEAVEHSKREKMTYRIPGFPVFISVSLFLAACKCSSNFCIRSEMT